MPQKPLSQQGFTIDQCRDMMNYMFGSPKQKLVTDHAAIEYVLARRLEPTGIFPNKEAVIKALAEKSLRIYLGIDPTGQDIHLGHSIPLLFLKQLWQLGHQPVIVIGDFTARIGDPTGKSLTRKALTESEIKENAKDYIQQIQKILPKGSFEVKYNNDWLGKMFFGDILKLASHVTVQQMIQRDMFQERLQRGEPIGLHEFFYPLMQGYDSVAMEIDGEVGGNDQIFNMLVGRDLEHKLLQKDKLVFATKLLVSSASGKKMSKSEGTLVAITDTPQDMFGKTMAGISDDMIADVFQLCTERDEAWIDSHRDEITKEPYNYKKQLGRELVTAYHGAAAAEEAAAQFEKIYTEGKLPDTIPEISNEQTLIHTIVVGGLASSNSEGKRLVDQGAVRVNETVVKSWDASVQAGDIIQVGPRKFAKVK